MCVIPTITFEPLLGFGCYLEYRQGIIIELVGNSKHNKILWYFLSISRLGKKKSQFVTNK